MKTILYNTITHRSEGEVRQGLYNDIYDSRLSTVQGELPEYVIQLAVVENPLEISETETLVKNEWVIDLILNEYRLEQTKRDKTIYEIAMEGWLYPQFAKRIIAPMQLVLNDVGSKMYNWFNINDFPIVKKDPLVHVYCNTILPEHDDIINAFAGLITIEDIPIEIPREEKLKEPTQIQV